MTQFLRSLIALCHKDLLSDLRQRNILNTILFFGVLVTFLFSLSFSAKPELLKELAPSLLWVTVLFSSILALDRSFGAEFEEGCLDRLVLYVASPRILFLAKFLVNFIFILIIQCIVGFLMLILFDIPTPKDTGLLILSCLLGDIGIATLGTFYAALVCKLKARQALLPLLLFPMLTPLLLASLSATQCALAGDLLGDARLWIQLLSLFDLLFLAASLLSIEPLLEA